jgi:hypothetical protein
MKSLTTKLLVCPLIPLLSLTACRPKDSPPGSHTLTAPGFEQVEGINYAAFSGLPPFNAKVESITIERHPSAGTPYLFLLVTGKDGQKVGLGQPTPTPALCEAVSKLTVGKHYLFPDAVLLPPTSPTNTGPQLGIETIKHQTNHSDTTTSSEAHR